MIRSFNIMKKKERKVRRLAGREKICKFTG